MPAILGNLIAILLVALLVFVSGREIWKSHKSGGCGGSCSGCSGNCAGCGKSCSRAGKSTSAR